MLFRSEELTVEYVKVGSLQIPESVVISWVIMLLLVVGSLFCSCSSVISFEPAFPKISFISEVDGTKTFSKVALFLEDKFSLIEPAISSARLSGSK